MTKHPVPGLLHMAMALLSVLCTSATAIAQDLPIRHGIYVVDSWKCTDAPNAGIVVWDGIGFSGAHSSGCTSHVAPMPNGSYRVATACTALGDGTPDPAGAAFEDMMILKRFSSTKFTVTKATGVEMKYRWCGAK